MSAGAGGPTLRVHLRLSEREAHVVSGLFAQRAYVRVVALIRDILGPGAQHVLAERLARHAQRAFQLTLPTARRMQLAGEVAEAMMTQIAKELPAMGALLEKAAADPAPGITLTFSFRFADVTAVGAGTPGGPTLSIRPGLHRD
jgi:hypothetical protein